MSRSEPPPALPTAEPPPAAEPPPDPAALADQLERLTALATAPDAAPSTEPGAVIPDEQLRRLLSAAIRLYAAVSERAAEDIVPINADVSTTDAVVLACALLKAHELNPFDLALWFSRTRVAG
jgi:hypothetical protein